MSEYRPPNRKSNYHKVPVKNNSKPGAKQVSKYNSPKKQKLPTAVLVTNILMICVILAVCGVVFAITFNNAKYDKADASKAAERSRAAAALAAQAQSAAQSTAQSTQSSKAESSANASSGAVSNAASSAAESLASSAENSETEPIETNSSDFDKEFFKDDLFIGDSIFTGLYGYSHIDRANVAASVGYTPYAAQVNTFDDEFYSGSAVDYAKEKQPKHIIIMLGSNGLSEQTDFDDFTNGYKGLLNALETGCSDSKLIVVSVPPVTADTEYTNLNNTIIDTANEKIKSLCSELGVTYYDFNNNVLKDANGYFKEEYAEADGLHFKGVTYPILLSNVQKLLKSE